MEPETRPHRGSDLFICFASRFSSSSMKIPSKSILSPGRPDKLSSGPASLSSSLSRRLRSNGSMKGGQASPMFPTGSKKRGCAFENPEPSSPKVTCIGQVRVKSKKKLKQQQPPPPQGCRSMRRAGSSGGGVSFRKVDHGGDGGRGHNHNSNSQRWVHLPLTICEALRAFGAEFNCFLPCRSSPCASGNEGKAAPGKSTEEGRSCGAAFVRWLVALQEGGGGGSKAREIELVIGEEEEDDEEEGCRRRGGSLGEMEIWDYEKAEISEAEEQDGVSVNVCVPPKNALLLMRCGSDPVRMSALANRLWESSVQKDDDEDDQNEREEAGVLANLNEDQLASEEDHRISDKIDYDSVIMEDNDDDANKNENEQALERNLETSELEEGNAEIEEEEAQTGNEPNEPIDESEGSRGPASGDSEMLCSEADESTRRPETEEENEEIDSSSIVFETAEDDAEVEDNCQELGVAAADEIERNAGSAENQETAVPLPRSGDDGEFTGKEGGDDSGTRRTESAEGAGSDGGSPDCLLLQLLFEPKLSMEVSKETWVCSTDFIQRRRSVHRPVDPDEAGKRSTDSRPPQSARASCSFPVQTARASLSTATLTGVASEPLGLTRCKSEPMRSASPLAPSVGCSWKNRKVGATGVGF